MATNKPAIPSGAPTKPLSRHASPGRRESGCRTPPVRGGRLSATTKRIVSPRGTNSDGETRSPPSDLRRQSSPFTRRPQDNSQQQPPLQRKISSGSIPTLNSRPLGISQQPSRPLPNVRSPTIQRSSRTYSVSTDAVSRDKTRSNTVRPLPATRPKPITEASKSSPTTPITPPRRQLPQKPSIPSIPQKPAIPQKPTSSQILPPKLPPKPAVLSEAEHNQLNEALKKFCNANKQLLAVAGSALQKVAKETSIDRVTVGVLDVQLGGTSAELKAINTKFSEDIREASHAYDMKTTCNVASDSLGIASLSSIICSGLKVAAVESNDESLFKQCLKAIATVKDSLIYVVDVLKVVSDKVDSSLVTKLEEHVKKTSTSHANLVGHITTGALIPVGARMEIEATIRATVVSIAKLVNSFNGPLEQSIVTEAKVASCCVAQMWATINETINTNTNLLSMPEIREIIIGYAADIKQAFAVFMEATKQQVSNPSETSFEDMKENERPIRQLLRKIVANIKAYSEIDTSERTEINVNNVKPTEKMFKEADAIVSDPPDIVPRPPTQVTQSSLDLPDDYVPSAPEIWDEPQSDEGRVLYTEAGNLRCSTLNKLVIHITANLDMNRMKTFITTYRSFTTPETLLTKVIQRYHVPKNAGVDALPIQLRCCNSLKYLIETQYEDFGDSFIRQLTEFLKELESAPAYQKFASIIKTTLTKKQEERQNTKTEIVNLTIEEKIPLSPAKLLFVINEEEIARQLTLVDFRIYQAIKPAELLNQAWSKPKYKYRAKNVLTLVARSTALTMWVASVILWQETLRGRVRAYTKMVNIAQHMLYLNNFNSLMAILAGISTSAIYRLKFTRDQIPAATKQVLEELTDLMDPTQSYGNYRQKLHDVDPPCVPFLGTYLTDITFIEDGNPDYVQGLINYRKRELVYSVIREIQQYQQQSYTYDFVNIAHFLTELASNDEESLYALSLIREPRGATLEQLP